MTYLFPLEGKQEEFKLSEAEHEALSERPFAGKVPSDDETRKVTVLWGPPNSGKTSNAGELFRELPEPEQKSTVSICYDEDVGYEGSGAIFGVPSFKKAYDAAVALMKKVGRTAEVTKMFLDAFRESRSDSQRGRSLTLNKAHERGFDMWIDTTSSSKGILKMVEILRKPTENKKSAHIVFLGTTAPLPLAEERSKERNRPVEYTELYEKRIGAYATFPDIVAEADGFVLYSNPTQGKAAQKVWEYDRNKGVTFYDPEAFETMKAYIKADGDYIKGHKDTWVASLHGKYVDAASKMLTVIEASRRPGFNPKITAKGFTP